MTRYFYTYFDYHYLSRALALYESLKRHCPDFRLWVLCLDEESHNILTDMKLPGVGLITLQDIEKHDAELARAKADRTQIEYYFTCTPSLALFIFDNFGEVDLLTYLDADLFFFSDPAPIYEEMAHSSIAIIEHRFSQALLKNDFARFGIYNVSWISFRRDKNGFSCIRWWRDRVIEWCHDRVDKGRYADQKYLDVWPERFKNVVVLRHKGAGLAPWNLGNYKIHKEGKIIFVDDEKLIFFHFHKLKQVKKCLYDPNLKKYGVKPSRNIIDNIYAPYIRALSGADMEASSLSSHRIFIPDGIRYAHLAQLSSPRVSLLGNIFNRVKDALSVWKGIASGRFIRINH
jgi:hypothetical protein